MKKFSASSEEIYESISLLASNIGSLLLDMRDENIVFKRIEVIGVPRGGEIPAAMLARALNAFDGIPRAVLRPWDTYRRTDARSTDVLSIFMDDIVDSGKTLKRIKARARKMQLCYLVAAVYCRKGNGCEKDRRLMYGKFVNSNDWIVFPWESLLVE